MNSIELITQLITNSFLDNKDGFGFFSQNTGIFKLEKNLREIEIGPIVRNFIKDDLPILAHIRSASLTDGKKEVKQEFNHPFESKHFIFAHNGTLEFKDKFLQEKNKENLDSLNFLNRMEEILSTKKRNFPIEELLVETMKEFTGKFAFLIFDKRDKKYYAARGKLAKLALALFSWEELPIGYIINTSQLDLDKNLDYFEVVTSLYGEGKYDFIKFSELKEESIFRLDDLEVVNIGEIKENTKEYVGVRVPYNRVNRSYYDIYDEEDDGDLNSFFTDKYNSPLDISELNYLANVIFKTPLIYLSDIELDDVLTVVKELERSNSNLKAKLWRLILKYSNISSLEVYKTYPFINFPYMLNETSDLRELANLLRKKV